MYYLVLINNKENIVKFNDDGSKSWIPNDLSNTDYQNYLFWLEDGNKVEILESEL